MNPARSHPALAISVSPVDLSLRIVGIRGAGQVVQADNNSDFSSLLFPATLRLLGIRHQRTDPFAPWQNGRIERLFRTVKEVIRQRAARTGNGAVNTNDLYRVRTWHNHLRPHQHLGAATPAEAWSPRKPNRQRRPRWVSEWEGLLAGCYWPD